MSRLKLKLAGACIAGSSSPALLLKGIRHKPSRFCCGRKLTREKD